MHAPNPVSLTDIVAIDGPAGVGKSSVAKGVAAALGFRHLDTGAMYRAATWWAMHRGIDWADPDALAAATAAMPLRLQAENGRTRVWVDDAEVTDAIRSLEVTNNIRHLDGIPEVRAHLVALQRQHAAQGPTVAEGRDMGTVVFPHARCKIFLDASLDERTRRRAQQLSAQGKFVDLARLRDEIDRRDHNDRTRKTAPLRPAEDAILIDTTHLDESAVEAAVLNLARAALRP